MLSHIQLFCKPVDCITPGSSVHGVSQARILKWVSVSFSRGLPDPGIKSKSPDSPTLVGGFFQPAPPGKPIVTQNKVKY